MIKLQHAELVVDENSDLLQAVLDEVGACIYIKDTDGRYRYTNSLTQRVLRRSSHEIIGCSDEEFFEQHTITQLQENDQKVLQHGETIRGEEEIQALEGDSRTYQVVKSPILNANDEVIGLFGVSTDITHIHRLKEELRAQATTDVLTGIFNRRSFFQIAEREFSKATRHNQTLSLIILDIDHFKLINDTYGHPTGDRVLAYVAQFLDQALRKEDVVARIGGEEFALLLPETPLQNAATLAERLRQQMRHRAEHCGWKEGELPTVSMGVASITEDDGVFCSLYARADKALYTAKNRGRNAVCSDGV